MEKFKKEIPFLLIAILPFIYLACIWNNLPEIIPMHWNGSGEIDDWGKKKRHPFQSNRFNYYSYPSNNWIPN